MPRLAGVGVPLIGGLAITAVLGIGLQAFGKVQQTQSALPKPPEDIGGWRRESGSPPPGEAERDAPPAVYYNYVRGSQPPVRVSIARAGTLNTYRPPHTYLLERNGRMLQNQDGEVARKGEKVPRYAFQVAAGHDTIFMMHWLQGPGDDPILDSSDNPGLVASTLFTHRPLYICDVWVALRPDVDSNWQADTLIAFAQAIDDSLKKGKP